MIKLPISCIFCLSILFSVSGADLRCSVMPVVPTGRESILSVEIVDDQGIVDRSFWAVDVQWSVKPSGADEPECNGSLMLTNGRGSTLLPGFAKGSYDIRLSADGFQQISAGFEIDDLPVREVSGLLEGDDLHWGEQPEVIRVIEDIEIEAGSVLTIEAGTLVLMVEGADWTVRGEVRSLGSLANPIFVDAEDRSTPWRQIYHMFNSIGEYRHVWFRGGGRAPKIFHAAGSAFYLVNCDIEFDHCLFYDLAGKAMDGNYARLHVRDSLVQGCASAGELRRGATEFLRCHIIDTWDASPELDYDGLYLVGPADEKITSCVFARCSDDGLDTYTSTVVVRDSIFYDIGDKGLSMNTGVTLINCLIFNCKLAGIVQKTNKVELPRKHPLLAAMNCTVVGNRRGYLLVNTWDENHTVETVERIVNSIIRDSPETVRNDYTADNLWIMNSNTPPGHYRDQGGNIDSDPRFDEADPFRLLPESPCIGTGFGDVDMGWLGFGRCTGDAVWSLY